jgi:hypothetical protein
MPPGSPSAAREKLTTALGPTRGVVVYEETLRAINGEEPLGAEDLYRFALALMQKKGLLEAVGRAIKIQAILMGAKGD